MNLVLRRALPRTSQPGGPLSIDWSNPLTRGLLIAAPIGAGGTGVRNAVDGSAPIYFGDNSPVVAQWGRARAFGGPVSQRIEFAMPVASGDMTMAMLARPVSTSGCSLVGAFKTSGGTAVANYVGIEANGLISAVATTGNNWSTASGRAAVAGELLFAAGSFAANGGRSIYVNGQLSGSQATARNPTGLDRLLINAYHSGSAFSASNGALAGDCVLLWNRVLSAAEHAALAANPWQLFAPQPRRLWAAAEADVGSGAAATVSGAQASPAAGLVLASGGASAAVDGASAAAAAGAATASGGALASVSGASATTAAGSVTATGGAAAAVSGAAATAAAGATTATGGSASTAYATATGASASAAAGAALASGGAAAGIAGAASTPAAGPCTAQGGAAAAVSGAAASPGAGAVSATAASVATAAAAVAGASALTAAGVALAVGGARALIEGAQAAAAAGQVRGAGIVPGALSALWRYDIPAASLRYDVPGASLRYDIPGAVVALSI